MSLHTALQPLMNTTATAFTQLQPVITTALNAVPPPISTAVINFFDFALSLEGWYNGIPVLDIAFGLFAARTCRLTADKDINFVQLYVSYILSTLGGSILVSYMLSQPAGWLTIDLSFIVYTTTFILFQMPVISSILLYITGNPIVSLIIQIFVDITWMTSITSYGYDNACKSPYNVKNSTVGPFLVAMVSGVGGPLLNQTLSLYKSKWHFTSPPILSDNALVRMVFAAVVTYSAMSNHAGAYPWKPFTRWQSRCTVLCIILMGDTVLSNVAKLMAAPKKPAVAVSKKAN